MKDYIIVIVFAAAVLIAAGGFRQKAAAEGTVVAAAIDASVKTAVNRDESPPFVIELPAGYRDWTLISVAHEEGNLNDIRAILGNDAAIEACREGRQPFPEGAIIARVAWSYIPSEENNKIFGRNQSFVAGPPTNGVQFMVKDSKKYASTGGWGYGQFNDGKSVDSAMLQSCFPCHRKIQPRDFVFTRYAP